MFTTIWKFLRQRRFHMVAMVFLGFFNLYSLRVNLSVAIVAMTEGTKSGYEAEFDWNSKEKGLILSSFFYGYLLTQFGGGILAKKIGGCRVFGLGIAGSAMLTLLTPVAARGGLTFVVLVRAIEGLFGGICYPAMFDIWSKWAPPMERSRLNAIGVAGMFTGVIVMLPVSGMLAENFGWRSVFYVTGTLACVWYLLWILGIRETPESDWLITEEEKTYIVGSLTKEESSTLEKIKPPTPWKKIFTSAPVLAICVANFAEDWGLYMILTQLPTYLDQIADIDLQSNGLIAAMPSIGYLIAVFPVSYLADWTRKRGYLTTTQVRKILSCSGQLGEAAFMITAASLAHPVYSTVFIILAGSLASFATNSYAVNALDIAPQYSSIIMGLSNSLGTVAGIICPNLVGFVVQEGEIGEWSIMFAITASLYLIGATVYFFFGTGDLQSWAKIPDSCTNETSKEKAIKSDS